jgi:hypothetical protein
MKQLFSVFIFCFLLSFQSNGQNYSVIPPDSLRFYLAPDGSSLFGMWFDSVFLSGTDTVYINTGQLYRNNLCWNRNDPAFFGHNIVVQSGGTILFFNDLNDTILIDTQAPTGSSWQMCQFSNGSRVFATIIAADTITWNNTPDSIKYFQMNYFDSLGNAAPFPVADSVFSISKSNGIITCPDVRTFPIGGNYSAQSIGIFTYRHLYDFHIHDTIQFHHYNQYGSQTTNDYFITYIIDTVYFSGSNDTVFLNPQNYYTNLDTPVINQYPNREIIPGILHYYELIFTPFCGHRILTLNLYNYGILEQPDPCNFIEFEEGHYFYNYFSGIPIPEEHYFEGGGCAPCNHEDKFLTYFSRQGWTCTEFGNNFYDYLEVIDSTKLSILTNHSGQFLLIKNYEQPFNGSLCIYDLSGKILLKEELSLSSFEEVQIATSILSEGLYFILCSANKQEPFTQRFVIIR